MDLDDLIQILPKSNWKIVHIDSTDGRGIDNAVIYDLDMVEVLESLAIQIDLGAKEQSIKDIRQVKFVDKYAKEELVIFVNHWPSRYGGELESNWKRVSASQTLQTTINRVDEPSEIKFIVMDDFNDHLDNQSVMGLTNCDKGLCLENLYEKFDGTEKGTYSYKGKWSFLDQILLSKSTIDGSSAYTVVHESGGPYKSDFMFQKDKKSGEKFPNRTYCGSNYYGGYSNHLPVKLTLVTKS